MPLQILDLFEEIPPAAEPLYRHREVMARPLPTGEPEPALLYEWMGGEHALATVQKSAVATGGEGGESGAQRFVEWDCSVLQAALPQYLEMCRAFLLEDVPSELQRPPSPPPKA
eukprot:COSAG01_NODE_908_length_12794_cov_119.794171_7_plen_114_part_00